MHGFTKVRRSPVADIPAWEIISDKGSIHLLQSGIGLNKAAKTAQIAVDLLKPDLIVSAGFCGALFPGLETGDIIAAEKLYRYSSGIMSQSPASDSASPELARLCENPGIRPGIFISTEDIVDKFQVISHIKHFATSSTVLEMESWSISELCKKRGIRFAAIRAVSDPAENDPAELFRNICDNDFNISFTKIARLLLRKPLIIAQLVRLARNSGIAGRRLADAVHHTLEQMK